MSSLWSNYEKSTTSAVHVKTRQPRSCAHQLIVREVVVVVVVIVAAVPELVHAVDVIGRRSSF